MRKANYSVIIGFVLCFSMIIFGIWSNGGLGTVINFIHIPSMIITFGGTFFAVLITTESFGEFIDGFRSIGIAFSKKTYGVDDISNTIFRMALISRKEGLLFLEESIKEVENDFLAKGLRLTVDGTDPDLLKDILETEMIHRMEENKNHIAFWEHMGSFAPAWGMLGTLIGLVNMMKTMGSDPGNIGLGMSLALITTLYGSILANWICNPIAEKLRRASNLERLECELIIEGILSIQAGDNPTVIREKIRAYRNGWVENEENASMRGKAIAQLQ